MAPGYSMRSLRDMGNPYQPAPEVSIVRTDTCTVPLKHLLFYAASVKPFCLFQDLFNSTVCHVPFLGNLRAVIHCPFGYLLRSRFLTWPSVKFRTIGAVVQRRAVTIDSR